MKGERIRCGICEKPMKDEETGEWLWADNDVHFDCFLKTAESVCGRCEEYYGILDDVVLGNDCSSCVEDGFEATMRKITEEDKNKLRKKHELKKGEGVRE